MHGYALDKLEAFLQPGMKGILWEWEWEKFADINFIYEIEALDIGSGSGYLTGCMASMVKQKYSIKRHLILMESFRLTFREKRLV